MHLSVETLRAWANALGPWGPLMLVALMVVQQLLPVFPGGVLSALAGALYGVPGGFAIVTTGSLCASLTNHTVGRGPGRALVHRWLGEVRMRALEARLAHHGWLTVAAIRALPIAPSAAVGYAAGIVGLPLRVYLLGVLVGTVPGNFLHVLLGDRLFQPMQPAFWGAVLGLGALAALALAVERRLRGQGDSGEGAATEADAGRSGP